MSLHTSQSAPLHRPTAGTLLRRWLSERIEVNPAYSLRAMARGFGVSPGYLSQVMSGRKRLATDRAIQFSQVMKLGKDQSNALLMAATLDAAKPGTASRALLDRLSGEQTASYESIELERFRALSGWYHVAILDLAETRGFRGEPAWIAKRLKISPVQAAEALERLQELGLLVKKGDSLRKSKAHLAVASRTTNAAIREHHKQMIGKALEALDDATPEAFSKRSVTGITIAVNPARIQEAFERIDRFRREMEALLSGDDLTEVYQLNVQLFNLTHNRSDS